jgi:probable rRNA maturation factor
MPVIAVDRAIGPYARRPPRRLPALQLDVQRGARINQVPTPAVDLRRWVLCARRVLYSARAATDCGTVLAGITLRFVGNAEAFALNSRYRHRNYATNVLTFGYGHHADIVLCLPIARAEARAQGKSVRDHLAHLIIHGVLHAGGLDHQRKEAARFMETLESRIMLACGLPDPWNDAGAQG